MTERGERRGLFQRESINGTTVVALETKGIEQERVRLARALGVGTEVLAAIGTEGHDGAPTPEATEAMKTLSQSVVQIAGDEAVHG